MNHSPLKITSSFWDKDADQDVETLLSQHGGYGCLFFNFPMCRNHSDIAGYYLEAAFIGEILQSVADDVSYVEEPDGYYGSTYIFSFHVLSYDNVSEIFEILGQLLSEENYEPPDELEDFRDALGKQKITFPDLIDSYYANMLGSNYDWPDDYRDEVYTVHPEWAYHCWRSARSPECGYPLYVSPDFWLIPAGADILNALKFVPDINLNDLSYEHINSKFAFKSNICLLGIGKTLVLSEYLHSQILEIASIVFPVEYDPGSSNWSRLPTAQRFKISQNIDFLVCEGNTFTYILFRENFSLANLKQLAGIQEHVAGWLKGLSFQAELRLEYKCNWELLNDEDFELVCYDLVRRDGRFVSSKVKKMGLAKSRDGGRDIIAYTPSRLGTEAKKWLIQCKHSLTKKTLGRNAIQLAELIDEYSPEGIIVATDLIVDAGLHDKIERIEQNRGIKIEVWDALEIERLLNKNHDLYNYHFNKER